MNFRTIIVYHFPVSLTIFFAMLFYTSFFGFNLFLKTIFYVYIIPCFIVYFLLFQFFFAIIGTPIGKVDSFPIKEYTSEIICEQITHSIFRIHIKNNEYKKYKSKHYFDLNMSGWIFKKTHIRDILLMNYHFDIYNNNKYPLKKLRNKRLFIGCNMKVIFILKNGKKVIMHMIKNGVEKRSIIYCLKIYFPLMFMRKYRVGVISTNSKKHYHCDLELFYL